MLKTATAVYFLTAGSAGLVLLAACGGLWFWLLKRHDAAVGEGAPLKSGPSGMGSGFALLPVAFLAIAIGFEFDGWWHTAVGRDSFWILPHLVVLSGALALTALSVRLLTAGGGRLMGAGPRFFLRSSLLFQFAFYIGLAFDDTAHRVFGQENISTALIAFAPPHLFMGVALFGVGYFLVRSLGALKLRRDGEAERMLLMLLVAGAMLALAIFQFQPFWPFGLYRVGGAWGQFGMLAIIGLFLSWPVPFLARVRSPALGITLAALALEAIRRGGGGVAPHVPFPVLPFQIPAVILYLSLLAGALAADAVRQFRPAASGWTLAAMGGLYGLTQSAVYVLSAKWWLDAKYAGPLLSAGEMRLIVALGALGGAVGFVAPYVLRSILRRRFPNRSDRPSSV